MELIYNLSMCAVLAVLILGTMGVMRPQVFSRAFRRQLTHRQMFMSSFATLLVFGGAVVFSEPDTAKQARLGQQSTHSITLADGRVMGEQTEAETVTQTETTDETVPFTEETYPDSKLKKGQTKVTQEGVNGEKVLFYEVTYANGVETGRTLVREEVTLEAKPKRTAVGAATSKGTPTQRSATPKPSTSTRDKEERRSRTNSDVATE